MAEDKRPFPTTVDGVEVIAATFAESDDPRPGREGMKMQQNTILHVMLANETEGFLCFHPNGGDCQRVYASPRSVIAHQKTHSDRMVAKRLQTELDATKAEKAAAEAELAERKQRRSEQAKKVAATRNANKVTKVVEEDGLRMPADARTMLADKIQAELDEVHSTMSDVKAALAATATALDKIEKHVVELRELPVADPVTLEKARRYELLTTPITQPIK